MSDGVVFSVYFCQYVYWYDRFISLSSPPVNSNHACRCGSGKLFLRLPIIWQWNQINFTRADAKFQEGLGSIFESEDEVFGAFSICGIFFSKPSYNFI